MSPSYFLPMVAKERGCISFPTPHETPLFLCRLYSGEASSSPLTPRHPFEEREKTPAPLRVCWRWRRCRILASVARRSIDVQPPSAHLLTFSTPFPILSLSDLVSRSLGLSLSDILSFSVLFSARHASRVRLSGFLSDTFASPTSVTRDCRDSENIDAVGGLGCLPSARPTNK